MELPKEPTPTPSPIPTGAVTAPMQKWIGIIVLGSIFCFIVIGWAISRWSGPSKSIMGPRQEKKQVAEKQPGAYQLNEEREKAYEQGKREASQGWWNQNRQQGNQQQTQINQVAQLTPREQAKQDYDKLLREAAMTDNMVEVKKQNDINTGLSHNPAHGSDMDMPRVAADERSLPVREPETLGSGRSIGRDTLPEGTIIYCALVNQLNGDNTGPVTVQVSNDVPYPGTAEVAIPQGSLFLGEAQKVAAQFQQRLAVSFHKLQIGRTAGQILQIDLKAPALDQQGAAALSDKVNNHYASIFGASLAVGAIGGLSQIGSGSYGGYGGIDTGTQVRNGISQSTAQSSSQILNRFLNRLPTVTIRPGTAVVVYLTANLEIPQ